MALPSEAGWAIAAVDRSVDRRRILIFTVRATEAEAWHAWAVSIELMVPTLALFRAADVEAIREQGARTGVQAVQVIVRDAMP